MGNLPMTISASIHFQGQKPTRVAHLVSGGVGVVVHDLTMFFGSLEEAREFGVAFLDLLEPPGEFHDGTKQ